MESYEEQKAIMERNATLWLWSMEEEEEEECLFNNNQNIIMYSSSLIN